MSDNIKLSTDVTFLQAADGEAAAGPKKFSIVAYTGAPSGRRGAASRS
jgi:hypothetical protein